MKEPLPQVIHKVANLYVDKFQWLVSFHRRIEEALVIEISRMYHEGTNTLGY